MSDETKVLYEEICELLENRKFNTLRSIITEMNEVDIAELIDEATPEQAVIIFRLLPKQLAAESFAYMDSNTRERLVEVLADRELRLVMQELFVDDVANMLEEMPASVVKKMLRATSPEDRREINQILQYPEDSAGSVLTTECVMLKAGETVKDAFDYIRRYGPDKETIYTCYVTDNDRHLQGVLTVKDLLLANSDDMVGDLMETNVISAVTTDDQEEVAKTFTKYDFTSLPVVDHENRLVGIITVDDVVDIIEQETTEDIEKMAAIVPGDKPYLKTGVFETVKNRIPWLVLLMFLATFTGMIITSFENALAGSIALTAFIPMIMNTGGNSGSQSSVAIIRSLALDDIVFKDIGKIIFKEARVSVICGVILAVANYVKIMLVDNLLLGSGVPSEVALVVCLTLLLTVVAAKIIGCTLPLLAKLCRLDPAVMASPFITTIVDAISLFVYFTIASAMLGI
ncbi:MAG: magnesium transporter [Acutalibacteraceae bacterium]|nr:magnesium transporter [Acutalibacteraceae bacterium]